MQTLRHFGVLLTLISFASTDGGFSGLVPSSHLEESAVAAARGGEGCNFPTRWEGNWFQSGVHTAITINRNLINTKGRCLEADGEKYLVFNERDSCYRCMVFHEKHYNVLQFKETFCVSERRSLKHICSTITGDANLLAMFRLEAVPIECPFKGVFNVAYNRGKGECSLPISSAEPCLHNSRYLLNFQACPNVPGTESTAEELQCLATWREGSSRYLLGLLQYAHPSSYEERFRCFVYEKTKKGIGSSGGSHANLTDNVMFRIAQSGDATCNGLSLIEGARMMTLRRAASSKPCQFPSWLQSHAQWHTLDQRSTFVFESSGLRVTNSTDLSGMSPNSLTMTALCSQILESTTPDKVMLILHSTSDCRSGYICSVIYRRDGHIVELQLGNMARRGEDACHIHYFNQSQLPYITLVSSTPETRQCPHVGRFHVTGFLRDGRTVHGNCNKGFDSLSVGCNSLDTLKLRSECASADLTAEYACHGGWEETGVSYLIATPLSRASTAARRYCFVFRETTSTTFTPQKLKSSVKNSKLKSGSSSSSNSDSSLELNNSEETEFVRILQFSSIADSCRRNVLPGIEGAIAFNVTSNGRCNDLSSKAAQYSILYQNFVVVLMLFYILY